MCVQRSSIFSSETWTLKRTDKEKILVFEMYCYVLLQMYCYRRILQLSWTQKVRTMEIRKRLNVKEDLIQKVVKRKIKLFVHIARRDNRRKVKSVMLGIIEGKNRKRRPCREWILYMHQYSGLQYLPTLKITFLLSL